MNIELEKRIDYYVGGFFILILKPFVFLIGKIIKRDHQLNIQGRILFIYKNERWW